MSEFADGNSSSRVFSGVRSHIILTDPSKGARRHSLEKRELGKTREKIPVIGMGTWEMGDVQNEGRALELQALRRG